MLLFRLTVYAAELYLLDPQKCSTPKCILHNGSQKKTKQGSDLLGSLQYVIGTVYYYIILIFLSYDIGRFYHPLLILSTLCIDHYLFIHAIHKQKWEVGGCTGSLLVRASCQSRK